MNKAELKQRVCDTIDANRDKIIEIGTKIFDNPELGYKEFETAKLVASVMKELNLEVEEKMAVTGVRARVNKDVEGPNVAVMGELDSVICSEHEFANPETGAVHACGHNVQIAAMLGTAIGLVASDVIKELDGTVDFMAVPAEEYVELAFRGELKADNQIKYFGGKQEMIKKGYFDDIDVAMMIHSINLPSDKKVIIGGNGNGFVGKNIQFIGKEAHAGSAPEEGINALNAAMIAINNIHVQRETFADEDHIRVHPIITKGGDLVNVVPADVRMETYVRARTLEGIKSANEKVNRALIAGAYAVGANIKITEIPGYLPLLQNDEMDELFRNNVKQFATEDEIVDGVDFSGSTDFGDLSHLIPTLHPFTGGVEGNLHTRDFKIVDPETAYIFPAKSMAMTVIDLLFDQAKAAKEIKANFKPAMTKEVYLDFLDQNSRVIEK